MTPERESEVIEGVQLLHTLCKPVKLIAKQFNLTEATVRKIIAGGRIPQAQRDLFSQPTAGGVSER